MEPKLTKVQELEKKINAYRKFYCIPIDDKNPCPENTIVPSSEEVAEYKNTCNLLGRVRHHVDYTQIWVGKSATVGRTHM